jgi:hypothetical protein
MPKVSAIFASKEPVQPSLRTTFAHGSIAPSRTLFDGSGTTRDGSISGLVPRPLHSGHMPSGELNEKLCGDSSGNPWSQRWHQSVSE